MYIISNLLRYFYGSEVDTTESTEDIVDEFNIIQIDASLNASTDIQHSPQNIQPLQNIHQSPQVSHQSPRILLSPRKQQTQLDQSSRKLIDNNFLFNIKNKREKLKQVTPIKREYESSIDPLLNVILQKRRAFISDESDEIFSSQANDEW